MHSFNNTVNAQQSKTSDSSVLGVRDSVDPVVDLLTVGQHVGNYLLTSVREINTGRNPK